ncbi:tetratricopeptide repeat domain-containing protein [Phyllosticta capitalensis]
MSRVDLIYPPPNLPPTSVLRLSQLAPRVLSSSPQSSLPWPLSLIFNTESQEVWATHENLLLACVRTGDDRAARQCLERLTARFGADNQRVQALKYLYESATAEDDKALRGVLEEVDRLTKDDPTNLLLRKRRVAILRTLNRPAEAIVALVDLLDFSPTDAESWAELSDLYLAQKLYSQAIFAMEDVLLITPFAWNVQARMGELLYISATAAGSNEANALKQLCESMRRFCRSIELCDNYLRGYYGLKLTTKRLLGVLSQSSDKQAVTDTQSGDLPPPTTATVEKLHELATSKLAEIVRRSNAGESGWEYDQAEVIAARELLDRDSEEVPR